MGKNLFNEKTIIKNIERIELTSKQKSASKRWIELLEKNELQEEVANYPKFMIHVLKDLLGYDITNFKHEEKNMEFPFRDKLGNFLVCFEAKGTKTKDLWALQGRSIKIRETPVNQINDYLYKNKIPYGILTNYKEFVLFKREEGYTKYHKIDFLDIKKNPDKLKEFIFIFSKESFEIFENFVYCVINILNLKEDNKEKQEYLQKIKEIFYLVWDCLTTEYFFHDAEKFISDKKKELFYQIKSNNLNSKLTNVETLLNDLKEEIEFLDEDNFKNETSEKSKELLHLLLSEL